MAPIGWPLDSRPPEGLTGIRPPSVVAPDSARSPPAPLRAEAKVLRLQNFAEGCSVVHLGEVHFFCAKTRFLVGGSGGKAGYMTADLDEISHGSRAKHGRVDPDRSTAIKAIFVDGGARAKDGGGCAVGDRRTHGERERIGDRRRGKHLVHGHRRAKLRAFIAHGMAAVLGGDNGELALGQSMLAHMGAAEAA